MTVIALKYAKVPSSFVHPAGLFVSLPKGERAKQKLDVTYAAGGLEYRFWGPEPLDSLDLRVLQGLVALGTNSLRETRRMLRDGRALEPEITVSGDALLDRVFFASTTRTIAVRLRISSFVESLGYAKGGSMGRLVRESITRLSAVSVVIQGPDFETSYRLISGYTRDKNSQEMIVGLNPTLTVAVFARSNYLGVSLDEARQLKDVALILHWRLHFINQGQEKRVGMRTLCDYVYPLSKEPVAASTMRRRHHTIRQALGELRGVGWSVLEEKSGMFTIFRPSLRGRTGTLLALT